METLIIDRSKWARGGKNGAAALLNGDGCMCCLGFEALRRGFDESEIRGIGDPSDLPTSAAEFDDVLEFRAIVERLRGLITADEEEWYASTTHLCDLAIQINDNKEIPDEPREKFLSSLFEHWGILLVFTDGQPAQEAA